MSLKISITGGVFKNSGNSLHFYYKIEITQNHWVNIAYRKYSEFRNLAKKLHFSKNIFRDFHLPQIPSWIRISSLYTNQIDKRVLVKRGQKLEIYLKKLEFNNIALSTPYYPGFLGLNKLVTIKWINANGGYVYYPKDSIYPVKRLIIPSFGHNPLTQSAPPKFSRHISVDPLLSKNLENILSKTDPVKIRDVMSDSDGGIIEEDKYVERKMDISVSGIKHNLKEYEVKSGGSPIINPKREEDWSDWEIPSIHTEKEDEYMRPSLHINNSSDINISENWEMSHRLSGTPAVLNEENYSTNQSVESMNWPHFRLKSFRKSVERKPSKDSTEIEPDTIGNEGILHAILGGDHSTYSPNKPNIHSVNISSRKNFFAGKNMYFA